MHDRHPLAGRGAALSDADRETASDPAGKARGQAGIGPGIRPASATAARETPAPSRSDDTAPGDGRGGLAWLGALSLGGFAGLLAAWFLLPMDAWLQGLADWANGYGALGVVIVCLAYVVGTVLMVPGFPMTLAVAIAYGWWALLVCMVCGLTAAAISFLVARFLARDLVRRLLETRPVLKAVDSVTSDEGFRTILLARLTPITPFAVENYAFGVTGVRFRPYMLGTAVGIVPGTISNVWIGVIGRKAAEGETGLLSWIVLGLGLAATIYLSVWMTRKANRKLAEERGEASGAAPG